MDGARPRHLERTGAGMVEHLREERVQVPLGRIARIQSGLSQRSAQRAERDCLAYWPAVGAIRDSAAFGDISEVPLSDAESDRFALAAGDLLVARAGGGLGPTSVAVWREQLPVAVYLDSLIRIRPSRALDSDYLRHLWTSSIVAEQLDRAVKGPRGRRALRPRDVQTLVIPLPPLAEQQRVARALEESLDRLDRASGLVQANMEKVRLLEKRIIASAVPIPVPTHWRMVTVAEVGEVDLGRQRRPEWHKGPNMKPYLRVADVFEDRIETADLAQMHFPDEVFARFRLAPGDILLNEGQSLKYLGRPAMYRGELEQVAFTNSLLRFRAGELVDPEWALIVFRRHLHSGRFAREARMTTNLAHLSKGRFAAIEFPLPELGEQKRIAYAVRRELVAIKRLASALDELSVEAQSLGHSLLREAFLEDRLVGPGPSRLTLSVQPSAMGPCSKPTSHQPSPPIWIQQELPL